MLARPVSAIPAGQNISILDEIRITVAGTADGTTVDLAKLGMGVYPLGAIGNDELGNFVINTLSKYGVHTEGMVRKEGVQTTATMLPIRLTGRGFLPGTTTQIWWRDPLRNEFQICQAGAYLSVKTDGKGQYQELKPHIRSSSRGTSTS